MKKILLLLSAIGITGCNVYTLQNDWPGTIKVGEKTVSAFDCVELEAHFFGLFGDFPVVITKEDGSALNPNIDKDREYEAAHWNVDVGGVVEEVEKSCGRVMPKKMEKTSESEEPAVEEEAGSALEDSTEAESQSEETSESEEPAVEEEAGSASEDSTEAESQSEETSE